MEDLYENLPLLFMGIGFAFVTYYVVRQQLKVNSVFRRVGRMGNLQGTDKWYPGKHGILNGRSFYCYYEEIESKPGQPFFLLSLYLSRNMDVNIVFKLDLKGHNVYGLSLPQKSFQFQYLPDDIRDEKIKQLMFRIISSKDFEHFVRISIEGDAVKYHHHITGMETEYIHNIVRLLFCMAERVERIGPVFRIKGFDR
jgi:hypothetical protein